MTSQWSHFAGGLSNKKAKVYYYVDYYTFLQVNIDGGYTVLQVDIDGSTFWKMQIILNFKGTFSE